MFKKFVSGAVVYILGLVVVMLFSGYGNAEQSYFIALVSSILYLASILYISLNKSEKEK